MDIKLVRHQTELFAKTLLADVAEVFASVMFLLDVYQVWSLQEAKSHCLLSRLVYVNKVVCHFRHQFLSQFLLLLGTFLFSLHGSFKSHHHKPL